MQDKRAQAKAADAMVEAAERNYSEAVKGMQRMEDDRSKSLTELKRKIANAKK